VNSKQTVNTPEGIAGVIVAVNVAFVVLAGLIGIAWNLLMPGLVDTHFMTFPEALGAAGFVTLYLTLKAALTQEKR
jgi:hypothetical protein